MSVVVNFLTGTPRPPVKAAQPHEPPPGKGRFGDLLGGLWENEANAANFLGAQDMGQDMGASENSEAVAHVFNQNGLFAGPVPASAIPSGLRVETVDAPPGEDVSGFAVAAAQASATAPRSPSPGRDTPLDVQPFATIASGTAALGAYDRPLEGVTTSRSGASLDLAPPGRPLPWPSLASRSPGPLCEAGPERSSAGRPSTRLADARAGATLDTQVSLQDAEPGANVIVRVTQVDRGERMRLRDRIGTLLARYGIRTREVRVNGEAGIVDHPRKEDR